MGNRRRFAPRSRQFNERQIEVKSDNWGMGMVKDRADVPSNALANHINGRDFGSELRGRTGTLLFTAADIGITITDNTESLSTFIQSGELYAANSDTIPSVDDIFMVYGTGDTTGNDLQTAKEAVTGNATDPLRKYDMFKVSSVTLSSESVTYLGNLRIPPLEDYGDTSSTEFTATKSGTTVTITSGPSLTSALENHLFVWGENGKNDVILSVTSTTTFETAKSETRTSTTMCYIRPPIRASLYHRSMNKLIFLFGTKLYIADDIPITGWSEIHGIRYQAPYDVSSELYIDGDDAILLNPYGIYRIKFEDLEYPTYWRINEPRSETLPTEDYYEDETAAYRYIVTQSKFSGSLYTKDRTDAVDGMVLELESCPPVPNQTDGRDYTKMSADNAIDSTYPIVVNPLVPGENQRSFTHYSIYRTDDILDPDVDDSTVENTFVWIADIPMIKSMYGRIVTATTVNIVQGMFEDEDIGSYITFKNGSVVEIVSITDSSNVVVKAVSGETSGVMTTNMACAIGIYDRVNSSATANANLFVATQTAAGLVTIDTSETTFTFYSSSEGKQIFWSDGSMSFVTDYVSASSVKVNDTTVRTAMAGAVDPVSRCFNDTIEEDVLRARLGSGEPLYFLGNRFFEPLPNANVGSVIPGFIIVAQRDFKDYYYSQTGSKRNAGYYHPLKQKGETVLGGVQKLHAYPDGLIIRGTNFTYRINTVVTEEGGDTRFGESVSVLKSPEIIDDLIGARLGGSSCRYDEGAEFVFTTEPAVRMFDGYKYGPNLAAERIQESDISKLNSKIILSYSHNSGLNIFGKQEI